jgi:hypothetical protein
LLLGDAVPELADDGALVHAHPFLDDAPVPDSMKGVARATPCDDAVAAPVILE